MTDVFFTEYHDIDGNRCLKLRYYQNGEKFTHRDVKFNDPPRARRNNFYKDILAEVEAR